MKFVTGGGLRVDYLITHDGQAHTGLIGGNALYAAVGAALWSDEVGLWARMGENYPEEWLAQLRPFPLHTAGLIRIPGPQDHRTFFAYTPNGPRDDTNPAAHFARISQPLPEALRDYVHSTPGQDNPDVYEPLALRPDDWPDAYDGVTANDSVVVHLSPLSLATHRHIPAALRQRGVRQVTLDPGERYMIPERANYIRQLLPQLDAFLPSDMEVRSLFGQAVNLQKAAATLCEWGTPLIVIKNGANGVLVMERGNGRVTHLPAYHPANDPRVVDVTGAGDSFCGGFMVGLAQTGSPIQAARMGLVSASLVIEGYGALYALGRGQEEAQMRLKEIQNSSTNR
ncbi:MAG: carbohydrate kinase family protein [Ardenticatenaceae bacterium]|nr:carbohydrate kinase family protein [Ardenticatenaceae bacterium]MCB9444856.1 carbohydrate kinase family protein [Ardenticatenaceae bacterium]